MSKMGHPNDTAMVKAMVDSYKADPAGFRRAALGFPEAPAPLAPGTAIRKHGGISLVLGPTSAPDGPRSPRRTPVLCFDADGLPFRYDAPTDLLSTGRTVWAPLSDGGAEGGR